MNESELNPINKQPLVSILVATYNGEKYLRKQLDSIINQTHKNLEIIIQDDGSNDSTLEILEGYVGKDSRISASKNETNLGIIQNFYDLIGKSNGEFIAISDQDDIWALDKIETLVNHIGDNSLIYTDSTLINDDDDKIGMTLLEQLGHKPKEGRYLTNLLEKNTISGHACLFKSDLTDKILSCRNIKFNGHFMYDQLVGTVASFRDGVTFYDVPLTYHRIHSSNNHNVFSIDNSKNKEGLPKKKGSRKIRTPYQGSFISRKRARIKKKVTRHYRNLLLLEKIFTLYADEKTCPFHKQPEPKDKFNRCFFNRKFYNALLEFGVNEEEAKRLSRGKWFYTIIKFF